MTDPAEALRKRTRIEQHQWAIIDAPLQRVKQCMRTNIRVDLADSRNEYDIGSALALGLLVMITNGIRQLSRIRAQHVIEQS